MFTLLNNFRLDSPASGGATGNGHRRLTRRRLRDRRGMARPAAGSSGVATRAVFMGDERETTDNGW
jgi:hypothetical protein